MSAFDPKRTFIPVARLHQIPLALVILRALLAPVILVIGFINPSAPAFAACLVVAFLSDYFDGVLARRLGVATSNLRRLDSIADTLFYVCAALAAYATAPQLLQPHYGALAILFALEVLRYAYDLLKFGKEASYHMWSSKLWGLLLFLAMFSVLVLHAGGWIAAVCIYWGILTDIEGLAISATLQTWRTDVPTLWHARLYARTGA